MVEEQRLRTLLPTSLLVELDLFDYVLDNG